MGIYVFNRQVLIDALANDYDDFGKHIIPAALQKYRVFAYIFQGYWEDIGTVRAFFEANLALTDPVPTFNFFDHINPNLHPAAFPAGQQGQRNAGSTGDYRRWLRSLPTRTSTGRSSGFGA